MNYSVKHETKNIKYYLLLLFLLVGQSLWAKQTIAPKLSLGMIPQQQKDTVEAVKTDSVKTDSAKTQKPKNAFGFSFAPIARSKAAEVGLTANGAKTGNADTTKAAKDIKWNDIPVYTAQKVMVTDEAGNPVLNEDGTQQYRVFLVDQFGNKRSKEAVKAQQAKLNKAIGNILLSTGVGAGVGAAAGRTIGKELGSKTAGTILGALAGAVVGITSSKSDIEMAKKQRESLKQQKALLEAYAKTFSDEGKPVDAKVDLSQVEGLDLKEDNTLTMAAADIKKELESSDFSTTDDSAFDF